MPLLRLSKWCLAAGFAVLLSAPMTAFAQFAPEGPQGPREVGVMIVQQESVPYTITLPGRAVAYQETGIRPQVGGEVLDIAYEAGRPVAAGTLLFRLDPENLAAALAAAEARVAGAEASLSSARSTVERYRRLEGSGVSSVARADAEVALTQAEADLKAAEAERDSAALALRRTEITSPIDGVPDVADVSVGDIVTANQSESLTTITQLDPIYVDVNESSVRLLRNRGRVESGDLTVNGKASTRLLLETGEPYPLKGRLVSPGITVSPTTGTVPIRLEFDNPDQMILPGQFLRVEMTIGTTRAVLIPQRATTRASDGTLTAFVARDGRAQQVTLTESGAHRSSWIVTQGIAEGEAVILDGLTNLRPGAEIVTVPVMLDADGVVRPADAQGAAAAPDPSGQEAPGQEGTSPTPSAPAGDSPTSRDAGTTAPPDPARPGPSADLVPDPAADPAPAESPSPTRPLPRPSGRED